MGRVADLGGEGERQQQGGLRTLAATGGGSDGEGCGPWRRRGAEVTGRTADLGGDGGVAATGRVAE
jgi:hypothetical protein